MAELRAYRGEEPYIFISYAHKDSGQVLPLLEAMQSSGYRIWYDEGIAAGVSWAEYIASHLLGSAFVLVFLSPESAVSPNCAREIHYAAQYEKPIAAVRLREASLSPGLEMQLSTSYSVDLRNFSGRAQAHYAAQPDTSKVQERKEKALHAGQADIPEKQGRRAQEDTPEMQERRAKADTPQMQERRAQDLLDALSDIPEVQVCRAGEGESGGAGEASGEKDGTSLHAGEAGGREKGTKPFRRALLPLAAAAALILLAASVFLYMRGMQKQDPVFDPQTQYRFVVTPIDGEEGAEFDSDMDTIRERLGILMEGRNWNMLQQGNTTAEMWLNKEAMGDHEAVDILRYYITRPERYFIFDEGSGNWYPLTSDLIRSASVEEGTLEGVDAAQYGLSESGYRYIRLEMEDAFSEAVPPANTSEEPLVVFTDADIYMSGTFDDIDLGEPAGYVLVREDGDTFALLDAWQEPNLINVHCYNLTHEPLTYMYGLMELPPVEWADGEETDAAETVEISFLLGQESETASPGQLLDSKAELAKAALTLDPSGLEGSGQDERQFYLRLSKDRVSSRMLDILCADTFVISLQKGLVKTDLTPEEIAGWEWQDERLILQTENSLPEIVGDDQGGDIEGALCLLVNNVPLFLGGMEEDGTLAFEEGCFDAVQDGTLDPYTLSEFLRICIFENRHPLQVSWKVISSRDEEGAFEPEWFDMLHYESEMSRLYSILHRTDPDITLLRNSAYLVSTQVVIRLDENSSGEDTASRLRALERSVLEKRLLEGSFLTGILFTEESAESGALLQIEKEMAEGTAGRINSVWLQSDAVQGAAEQQETEVR